MVDLFSIIQLAYCPLFVVVANELVGLLWLL